MLTRSAECRTGGRLNLLESREMDWVPRRTGTFEGLRARAGDRPPSPHPCLPAPPSALLGGRTDLLPPDEAVERGREPHVDSHLPTARSYLTPVGGDRICIEGESLRTRVPEWREIGFRGSLETDAVSRPCFVDLARAQRIKPRFCASEFSLSPSIELPGFRRTWLFSPTRRLKSPRVEDPPQ